MFERIICFLKTLRERQILILLLAITLGLRLYAVLMAKGIAYDGAAYGFMARDFLKGHFDKGLSTPFHPLYPFLISLISPGATYVEIAGRTVSLIFGTLTLIPLFYLVKETLGEKEAYFSGLFYSFHSYLVTYSGMLLSEATYWGLLTLSIYFFWRGLSRRNFLFLMASGAFLGLAYLTRPEGIIYLPIFLIWVIVDSGVRKGWAQKVLLMGSLLVAFLVLALPYLIHIREATGQWLISKKGVVTQSQLLQWVEVNEGLKNEGLQDPRKEDAKSEKVIEQPRQSTKYFNIVRTGDFILQYFPFTIYHYFRAYHFALWFFLFLGLIRARRHIKIELFLASLILFHLISLATFTTSTIRFSVPVIPISLFWAGAGVLEIQKYLSKRNIAKPGKWVFSLIILFILIQLPESLKPERRHRAEQRKVGLWLNQNTPKDAVIMSNSPIEAFYADREFISLPQGISTPGTPGKSYREIIQFVKQRGVKYILINKNTSELNPDFSKSIQATDLKEFYKYKDKNGNMTIVYEVFH